MPAVCRDNWMIKGQWGKSITKGTFTIGQYCFYVIDDMLFNIYGIYNCYDDWQHNKTWAMAGPVGVLSNLIHLQVFSIQVEVQLNFSQILNFTPGNYSHFSKGHLLPPPPLAKVCPPFPPVLASVVVWIKTKCGSNGLPSLLLQWKFQFYNSKNVQHCIIYFKDWMVVIATHF